ncbi:hypothetical protein CPC08DRAFT_143721 [Agrocybe pediades]|nr:hypothetical protein CPC08DRAFT_143721 [Agrocybe pediades]
MCVLLYVPSDFNVLSQVLGWVVLAQLRLFLFSWIVLPSRRIKVRLINCREY